MKLGSWRGLFPLAANEVVGFDFEEPLEDQRKALAEVLSDNLHVIVVYAEESLGIRCGLRRGSSFFCVVGGGWADDVAYEQRISNLSGERSGFCLKPERFGLGQNMRAHEVANLPDKLRALAASARQRLVVAHRQSTPRFFV